jgi:sugar/nucleoside kinase (ribokinase family)
MTDVYVYGMISPSLVYVLRRDFSFPERNGYAEIARSLPSIGGEAANSAIVLARLGLSVKLDGNWLNAAAAERVAGTLAGYGIDVSRLTRTDTPGTDEIVIADGDSRTVFGNYAGFHDGPRQWNEPRAEDVAEASAVCLDPYFRAESRLAAELCVAHGKPYVTLDCRHDDYVAQHAAIVAVSHELRDPAYPGRDMGELFGEYLEATYKPYEIEPLDTTGAGDSFRGALAYGLLQGWPDERVVDFASAVAACVCLTMPHALNAPDLEEVTAFLERRRVG